jgi:hypothetical protein
MFAKLFVSSFAWVVILTILVAPSDAQIQQPYNNDSAIIVKPTPPLSAAPLQLMYLRNACHQPALRFLP